MPIEPPGDASIDRRKNDRLASRRGDVLRVPLCSWRDALENLHRLVPQAVLEAAIRGGDWRQMFPRKHFTPLSSTRVPSGRVKMRTPSSARRSP